MINILGVRLGGQVQVALTVLKMGAVLAVIVFGLATGGGSAANLHPLTPASLGFGTFSGFLAALAAALWAYDGWENLTLVGSEVKDPQRNIPRTLIYGVMFVGGVYLLFSIVCHYVLPFTAVSGSQHVASDIVEKFGGRSAGQWMTLGMVIAVLGTLNSSLLTSARVPYAMARDRVFFHVADGIHAKFRTPARALLFQGALTSLIVLTGTFEDLTSLFIFTAWIFYGLTVVALFRLRGKEPDLPRPYRCWGYPWAPGLFVVGAFALTANLWLDRPIRSSLGLLVMLLGLPFYRHWSKQLMKA
jgi:APA family basic amino acid/polyamine antiporter